MYPQAPSSASANQSFRYMPSYGGTLPRSSSIHGPQQQPPLLPGPPQPQQQAHQHQRHMSMQALPPQPRQMFVYESNIEFEKKILDDYERWKQDERDKQARLAVAAVAAERSASAVPSSTTSTPSPLQQQQLVDSFDALSRSRSSSATAAVQTPVGSAGERFLGKRLPAIPPSAAAAAQPQSPFLASSQPVMPVRGQPMPGLGQQQSRFSTDMELSTYRKCVQMGFDPQISEFASQAFAGEESMSLDFCAKFMQMKAFGFAEAQIKEALLVCDRDLNAALDHISRNGGT